jgi:predicted PurR-regulated permease PerM
MLGIDSRAARAAWTVFLVALTIVVVYLIRRTILIFTLALLLAYLLSPLVNLLERTLPRRFPRALSLAVVYVLILVLVVSIGGAVGSRIFEEAAQLAGKIPEWLEGKDLATLPVPEWLEPYRAKAVDAVRSQLEANAQEVVPVLREIGERIISVVGNLGFVVLVPILSFFFLKDASRIRSRVLDQVVAGPQRGFLEDVFSDVHILLGQYMRALLILAAATFIFYGLFFLVMGVPYAALLAGLAGALEFVPVIGPLSASIVILLVAGFGKGFTLAVWVLVFLLVYRLFQDYVLQPYLMSTGVALHPLWVIFGVLAGEQIAGIPGMFLSIPVLATLRVVVVRIQKARNLKQPAPPST